MIRQPDIAIRFTTLQADDAAALSGLTVQGPLARQARRLAQAYQDTAMTQGEDSGQGTSPVMHGRLEVLRAPRAHTGLGTGTQLGMAIATAFSAAASLSLSPHEKAAMVQRGRRSAIGTYGFEIGGFIVEGGKLDATRLSPMLIRQDFPEHWRIVLVCPDALQGLAGSRELQAFADMPDIPDDITARMCQLVLLGMTPAIVEHDLESFGQALYELQRTVGQCFQQAQGGVYAHESLERMVAHIRRQGVAGVGQSSWGPTLYAVTGDQRQADHLAGSLRETFSLHEHEVIVTKADNRGSVCKIS